MHKDACQNFQAITVASRVATSIYCVDITDYLLINRTKMEYCITVNIADCRKQKAIRFKQEVHLRT